ncbi:DUF4262 domain-containing protein [Erythrobacter sp. F6033]|uniref:DUF4262 domain-containing protein n=1 Tax=Erythrobacter sp. F6033 TaxID=2926401 RepID=UPI001FF14BEB|nr:DUF4262 domain-containing protein [Erythrobacter sp. F6033]MCK0129010.1 DUF4262 domain-containing protein [Erythrobacter sp. F6033]
MRNWFKKDNLSKFERDLISNVEKHGCHLNGVFDPDDEHPNFVYSIGFTKTLAKTGRPGVPEVVIFGLPGDFCGPAINQLLALCAAGQKLDEGTRLDSFFGDYDGIVRMVDPSNITDAFFNSAIWFHRTQMNSDLEDVAMLVWPDSKGVFPWGDGCEGWVKADQPALYEAAI